MLGELSESQIRRHSQAAEPHAPLGRPLGVDKEVSKALVCLLWTGGGISSNVVKTYRPVLHEFEAGAEVSQADVAIHIQQNVVGLNVPERRWRRGGELDKSSDSSGYNEDEENETFFQTKQYL